MPVNFSQGHGKEEKWQQATYWLSFFLCFPPNLSYPKPRASSPVRCISDAFWHLFYTSALWALVQAAQTHGELVVFLLSPISPSPPSTHTHRHILCFFFFTSPLNSLNSRNFLLAIFLIHLFDNFVQPKSSHLEQELCAKHFKSNL